MKNWKKIYQYLVVVTFLSALVSCEDMMDKHQDYIEGGEIIYAPKPDSIAFIPGKGRILFRYWLYNSPNVSSVDIFWNNGADSLIIPVTPGTGLDSSSVLLENMLEKSYTFNVRNSDKFGNKSLTSTGFGTSYGENYKSVLFQRKVKAVAMSGSDGIISWYSAAEDLAGVQVRYKTSNGKSVITEMSADKDTTLCPNVLNGSAFEYRSLYKPEKNAIDTFIMEWEQYEVPFTAVVEFDRSEWEVIDYSDQQADDGGGVGTLFDGDFSTFWHSSYGEGPAPLPHWVIIDLKSVKNITQIVTHRAGNTDANTIQYWTSDDSNPDAASWEIIAEGVYASDEDALVLDLEKSGVTSKRYLKLVLPDSNRATYTSISEVFIYGTN